MKKHTCTVLLSLPLVLALAGAEAAQTADDIVAKHLAALGGREALGKITSRKSTGTVTISTPGGDISGPIESYAKAPNKTRAHMTLDLSAMGAGEMTVEQVFDGTAGSVLNSMQGDTEITGNQLENMRNNMFPSPLLSYKERGVKIEMLPNDKVGGKDAIVLLATPKAGSAVRMFFDAETYLIVRTVTRINAPQMGGEIEQTGDFSDYRSVDGVKVAFRVASSNAMQSLTITLNKVEHNVAIDDAMFVKK